MKYINLVFAVMLIACCVSHGNIQIMDYSKNLVVGKTTKWTVNRDLGNPDAKESHGSGGEEDWIYVYAKATPTPLFFVPGAAYVPSARKKMMNQVHHKLTLKFDNNGLLKDYSNASMGNAYPENVTEDKTSPKEQNNSEKKANLPADNTQGNYGGVKGIILNNGDVIEGQVIYMDDEIVKIRTKEGKISAYSIAGEVKKIIKE